MNRRAFLVSSFIMGLNAALGNRIKPLTLLERMKAEGWQENPYFRCEPFKLEGPQTVYWVPEGVELGRAVTEAEHTRIIRYTAAKWGVALT